MSEAIESQNSKSAFDLLREWASKDPRKLILKCGAWAVFCWLINAVLIIGWYDGWGKVPFGGLATGAGNVIMGSLFWAAVSSMIFSRRHGPHKDEATNQNISQESAAKGSKHRSLFMWGVALGAVLFRFFGAVVPLYAATLLTARLSAVAFWVTVLSFRAWLLVVTSGPFTGRFPTISNQAIEGTINYLSWLRRASSGLLVGSSVNLVIDYFFPPYEATGAFSPAILLLLLAVAFCVWRATRGAASKSNSFGTGFMYLLTGAALAEIGMSLQAFADDGGWSESGGNLPGLLDNPGFSTSVSSGLPGGGSWRAGCCDRACGRSDCWFKAVGHRGGHAR